MGNPESIKEWAEIVATYYRELVAQELPHDLINSLVVSWQIHMIKLVELGERKDED